jgi:dTDP-4-amino-4,6-dideoxygalactose transaminase
VQDVTTSLQSPELQVPLEVPFFNAREAELAAEALAASFGTGSMAERFERAFARAVGARHAVAVCSTAAIVDLVATTAGWGEGDELLTTAFGLPRPACIARTSGAHVRLVDVERTGFGIDLDAVEAAITPRTRGIVAVGSFGWQVDCARLHAIADAHGIEVVEDATETIEAQPAGGATPWPRTYALGTDRALTAGGGAIACTDSDARARAWREIAAERDLRIGDLHAAVGVAQLEKLPRMQALRAMVWADYDRALRRIDGAAMLHAAAGTSHQYDPSRAWVLLDERVDRDAVIVAMREVGVEVRASGASIEIPPHAARRDVTAPELPSTVAALGRLVELPCHPQLSPQQQSLVVDALARAVRGS